MDKPTTAEIREQLYSTNGITHDRLMRLARILFERLEAAEKEAGIKGEGDDD